MIAANRPTNSFDAFCVCALLLVAAGLLLATLVMPQMTASVHASMHSEADEIRKCAASPENLLAVWLNSSGERLNCLIRLSDGRVGNYVIQYSCRQMAWIEITAYIVGDGTLAETIRVLMAKGCNKVYP